MSSKFHKWYEKAKKFIKEWASPPEYDEYIPDAYDHIFVLSEENAQRMNQFSRTDGHEPLVLHDGEGRLYAFYRDHQRKGEPPRVVFPYTVDDDGNRYIKLTPISWQKFTRSMRKSMLEHENMEILFEYREDE